MKKVTIYLLGIVSFLFAASCAKEATVGANDANKRYLEAWVSVNKDKYPNITKTGIGIYVIDEKKGNGGKEVKDEGFVFVDYTISNLDGKITSYNTYEVAKQMGTDSPTSYYGPKVWLTNDGSMYAGLQNAIVGMQVGDYKKFVIPSWLMSYSSYDTEAEYLKSSTDYSDAIYEVTVRDFTDSINVWQIDTIKRYIAKNYGSVDAFKSDTVGFYYKSLIAPVSDKEFPADTTIYINYTGKLLNGLVFDTTIERVAKDNNIPTDGRTFEPVSIKWGSTYPDLTMGSSGSTVIDGFARTLWQMKAMEKGIGIFYSPFGYGYNGSEPSIPPYAPLIFEIEIVEKPEE